MTSLKKFGLTVYDTLYNDIARAESGDDSQEDEYHTILNSFV